MKFKGRVFKKYAFLTAMLYYYWTSGLLLDDFLFRSLKSVIETWRWNTTSDLVLLVRIRNFAWLLVFII